jgi:hypothetical protein
MLTLLADGPVLPGDYVRRSRSPNLQLPPIAPIYFGRRPNSRYVRVGGPRSQPTGAAPSGVQAAPSVDAHCLNVPQLGTI